MKILALTILTLVAVVVIVVASCNSIIEVPAEPEGMGSSSPITYGNSLNKSLRGRDLGGSSFGHYYHITWDPEKANIEPIIDSMIDRMEYMQQTTSGSQENQKKLFELVDLKRKLSDIKDGKYD